MNHPEYQEMRLPTVKVYCEYDWLGRSEWHYTITGWPPPHERTTSSSGPFRSRRAAERDAKREVREHMRTWKKAKTAGNPNCQ